MSGITILTPPREGSHPYIVAYMAGHKQYLTPTEHKSSYRQNSRRAHAQCLPAQLPRRKNNKRHYPQSTWHPA